MSTANQITRMFSMCDIAQVRRVACCVGVDAAGKRPGCSTTDRVPVRGVYCAVTGRRHTVCLFNHSRVDG